MVWSEMYHAKRLWKCNSMQKKESIYIFSGVCCVVPSGMCMFHPIESWTRPGPRSGGHLLAVHQGGAFLSPNCGVTFFFPKLLARNRSQFSGACVVKNSAVLGWKSDSATMPIVSFSVQRRLGDTQGRVVGACRPPCFRVCVFF